MLVPLSTFIRHLLCLYSGNDRQGDDEGSGEDSESSSLSGSEEQSRSGSGTESDSGTDYLLLFEFRFFISAYLRGFFSHVSADTVLRT